MNKNKHFVQPCPRLKCMVGQSNLALLPLPSEQSKEQKLLWLWLLREVNDWREFFAKKKHPHCLDIYLPRHKMHLGMVVDAEIIFLVCSN